MLGGTGWRAGLTMKVPHWTTRLDLRSPSRLRCVCSIQRRLFAWQKMWTDIFPGQVWSGGYKKPSPPIVFSESCAVCSSIC